MRILLVDDEVRLLGGLRRSLRLERPDWQVDITVSGAEAVQLLQEKSYDILVTDMLMPGMDGATLLKEALQTVPGTVRIILSGHAGRALIQSCESYYHQFHAKPVSPQQFLALLDTLASGLERPETLRARRLVAGLQRVPSLPALHQELSRLLGGGHPSVEEVADLVSLDLGMSTKILKLVNSSGLGLAQKVTDLREAVHLLSVDLLSFAVLEHGALESAESILPSGLDLAELWEHSATVAHIMRTLALSENLEPGVVALAYTAGLLHDLGRVLMALNPDLDYQRVLDQAGSDQREAVALELSTYGTTHADVGAELLKLWGLDERVCTLVRSHHHSACSSPDDDLLPLLRFAEAWSSGLSPDSPYSDGHFEEADRRQPNFSRWAGVMMAPLPQGSSCPRHPS